MKLLFWFSTAVILYTYLGYPVLIWLFGRIRRPKIQKAAFEPYVSIIFSAFNEEKHIERKLANLLHLDYPSAKVEILVGSDGGSDATDAIISKFESQRIRFFRFVNNLGKPQVLNALIQEAHGDILIFTDARQSLDESALRELVDNFYDPKVGCVSGELHLMDIKTGVGHGVSAYWRYEKFLRKCESTIDSMLGATGAIYAIRKRLFKPIPNEILVDDMYIPLRIIQSGYRAIMEPCARAYDQASVKAAEEQKRKIRTLAGNYQIMQLFPDILNPFKSRIALQFLSHKALRLWVPFFLLFALISNVFLLFSPFYAILLVGQLLFYALAAAEALRESAQKKSKKDVKKTNAVVYLAYTFCLLNYCAVRGLLEFLSRKQKGSLGKSICLRKPSPRINPRNPFPIKQN